MLRTILNKSWRQQPTKQQLYGYLPPITKTIHVKWTKHAGHCWRSRDEFISDILLWTSSHGRAKVGRPAISYIQQLCADMECIPEDLPEAMDNREGWQERVRDIWADGVTWWWGMITQPRCNFDRQKLLCGSQPPGTDTTQNISLGTKPSHLTYTPKDSLNKSSMNLARTQHHRTNIQQLFSL